jgi:FkbM family methyltransferase
MPKAMPVTQSRVIEGIEAHYRPGTSDENALKEVIEGHCYRRKTANFDVESGESWLDLGGNIGSFALYCQTRKAIADCYEPDSECFQILEMNAGPCQCFNFAVTAEDSPRINFFSSKDKTNCYRGTILERASLLAVGTVPNLYAGHIRKKYDGIKMDIEGSEFGLIDNKLIPACDKLVMEYHSSRDSSFVNLKRRLALLREIFKHVQYPPEFDRKIAAKDNSKTFFDRLIFCWN